MHLYKTEMPPAPGQPRKRLFALHRKKSEAPADAQLLFPPAEKRRNPHGRLLHRICQTGSGGRKDGRSIKQTFLLTNNAGGETSRRLRSQFRIIQLPLVFDCCNIHNPPASRHHQKYLVYSNCIDPVNNHLTRNRSFLHPKRLNARRHRNRL